MSAALAFALATLLGYLLGGVPSAALAARARGRDIFRVGSGNMGAMNTARNLGWGLGALVLAADVGKGALAALLGGALAGPAGGLAAGSAAVLGHAASPWVGGRGGKALAAGLGAALPLYPWGGLAGLAALLLALALLRDVARASLAMIVLYPLLVGVAESLRGAVAPAPAASALAAGAAAAVALARQLAALRAERRTGGGG